jgi:transcriptional regulator with XRE-family HTH domain
MPGPLHEDVGCRKFAENLKAMRELAGMSQDELAAEIKFSSSVIASIEALHRAPTVEQGKRLDQVFKVKEFFEDAAKKIRGQSYPEPFRDYAEEEARADTLYTCEHSVIPGLLQTEDYARAVFETLPNTSTAEIERLVAARLARQEILTRDQPPPPMVWALMDEQALYRPVGGPEVMYAQLMHVVEVSLLPNVSVGVVPYTAGAHTGLSGGCHIAERDGHPIIVNLDDLADGHPSEDPVILRRVGLRFKSLQLEAQSPRVSRDKIVRVAEERWKAAAPDGARALIAVPTADSV